MQSMHELQVSLGQTTVLCKSGRRDLSRVDSHLAQSLLLVVQNQRKRARLLVRRSWGVETAIARCLLNVVRSFCPFRFPPLFFLARSVAPHRRFTGCSAELTLPGEWS